MNVESLGAPPGSSTILLDRFEVHGVSSCDEGMGVGKRAVSVLSPCPLTYTTYGTLNGVGDNCCLVGHSLTSNTNVHNGGASSWRGTFVLLRYNEIICRVHQLSWKSVRLRVAYYAVSGGKDGEVYGPRFPRVSVRDIARAKVAARKARRY